MVFVHNYFSQLFLFFTGLNQTRTLGSSSFFFLSMSSLF